ncbi:MAG TPA: TraR/DksA family transcriptional regulator [Deltaproteobacteria bacterium]|nr:TraR/DksA family transcriptional regulator [Deltaproteobacteria bacterium]
MHRLRRMLMDRKRRMWNDLRDDVFRKLGKEYNAQFDNPHDFEELALMDLVEDTGLIIADARRRELEQLDAAITRLDEGAYGICEECGEEIPEERLKAVPYATLCVKCLDKREKGA